MFRKAFAVAMTLLMGSSASAQVTPRPDVLSAAFAGGFVGEAAEKRYPVRPAPLGELDLPSGRLVLADPFTLFGEEKAINLAIPPGRYRVDLAVADTGEGGQRVVLARLLLSEKPPVRWAIAGKAGQDARTLKGSDVFGYDVDAGTGAFMDAGAVAWLASLPAAERDALGDRWQARGEAHGPELGMPHQFALTDMAGPGGVAMFSSGWGDGFYASWIGYDAQGLPTAVVTDFAVITAVNLPRN